MTDLVESSTWTPGIRQFETSDPVEGGPDGIDNVPLRQLANRTRFLKDRQEAHEGAVDPYPQYATKADLAQKVAALVDQSPEALNTLKELANALGNDPSFATTMTNALAQKAPIESPVFTGAPKAPTPGQFDSSDKVAPTGFVQRALGNMQTGARIQSIANSVFSASHAGGSYSLEVASTTYTLPTLASVKPGATFEFLATVNAATISTSGTDKMMTGSLVSSSTCVLNNGDTARFVSDGTYWVLVGGSAALRLSLGDFGSSIGTNGYQKFPNGLIIQWGTFACGAATSGSITYPIAFTTTALCMQICSYNDSHGTNEIAWLTTSASIKTTLTFGAANTNSASSVRWMAIGY
ncbi:gp53-like domain-containing protein [Burkholderia ubonensis]|uniref:gp53-like domain-containing protein n=1 Tax=Burkholderia ubonensis TaxID=101571 RepID=UPI00075EE808|nr:hypothetical protein [Burkholderia ubonensis]KVC85472.1 hypothetical protein WI74_30785 [Burkholderia ubonensis]KVG73430.1 hypothetical protein WJ34_16540 [Burkholderia ubonensis]KVH23643.1 hypothetical protein WJ37_11435 [Burkholderia ubonensis]KVH50327.1 hypothetical protein WJ38_11395 [Burkholderia ubonensis]KVH83604.1 hypothetical protein WJ43_19755 [Burkholderia ubonensis]